MSKLIVEVCRVESVENHPNADRMAIALVKGWKTCIGKNPDTGETQFKAGDKCVFFPPDSVLPPELANGPDDEFVGRLNVMKYLHVLPKNERGERPAGGRVVAARLRGQVSYGVIMAIDPAYGDDPNWEVGTDVAEYFGITKFEPPLESLEGDEERPNSRFYGYTSIENIGNYPTAIPVGDEVFITEKIHGKNCRIGLVIEGDEAGNANWTMMAGSHGVRRKEFSRVEHRFKIPEMLEQGYKPEQFVENGIFIVNGRTWMVETVIPANPEWHEGSVDKVHCFQVKEEDENDPVIGYTVVFKRSEFWEVITENIRALLEYLKSDEFPFFEPKHSVVLYGEIFGYGVQDMQYGLKGRQFRVFDVAINNQYLDFDVKSGLFAKFGIPQVPILYRGPFSVDVLENYTSGPTTICDAADAGGFKGREGVVVTPVKEVHYCPVLNGRRIVKSISADYLARKGGTEFH